MGNSIYLGGGIKSAFCGGNVKEIWQGTDKLFPSGGDFVYLTNFENYDGQTGIDTPIIGSPKNFGLSNYHYSYDAVSSIIGNTKYRVFTGPSFTGADRDFLCDFTLSDTYTIDFVVKFNAVSDMWRDVTMQGLGIYAAPAGTQPKTATAYGVYNYDSTTSYAFSCCPIASNRIYCRDGFTNITPNNWDTYAFGTGSLYYSAYYSYYTNLGTDLTRDSHVAIILDNASKQYRFYVNGILTTIAQSNILELVKFYATNRNKVGMAITNFAIRKGDFSIGTGTDSTFPVPSRPYKNVISELNKDVELYTTFKNLDTESFIDVPEIGAPYEIPSSSRNFVSKLENRQFHTVNGNGLTINGGSASTGILFNFSDGKPRSIELNYCVDSFGGYFSVNLRRKSDNRVFNMMNYHYYDYNTSIIMNKNYTVYNGSYNSSRGGTGQCINGETGNNSLYGINRLSILAAILDPVNNLATLYSNGWRACSCICTDWDGDWEIVVYGTKPIYVTGITIIKGDMSLSTDENLYRFCPVMRMVL